MFSKGFFFRVIESRDCVVKRHDKISFPVNHYQIVSIPAAVLEQLQIIKEESSSHER